MEEGQPNHIRYMINRIHNESFAILWHENQGFIRFDEDICGKLYAIPPLFSEPNNTMTTSLFKQRLLAKKPIIVMIVHAGAAICARFEQHLCKNYKLIKRYMIRKSQGKSQIKHLKTRGKSRLGSRIRLQQSEKFFEDINDFLELEAAKGDHIEEVFLSCGPTLKGHWWKHHPPRVLQAADTVIRKIPFHCPSPSYKSLINAYRQLSTFRELTFAAGKTLWE